MSGRPFLSFRLLSQPSGALRIVDDHRPPRPVDLLQLRRPQLMLLAIRVIAGFRPAKHARPASERTRSSPLRSSQSCLKIATLGFLGARLRRTEKHMQPFAMRNAAASPLKPLSSRRAAAASVCGPRATRLIGDPGASTAHRRIDEQEPRARDGQAGSRNRDRRVVAKRKGGRRMVAKKRLDAKGRPGAELNPDASAIFGIMVEAGAGCYVSPRSAAAYCALAAGT